MIDFTRAFRRSSTIEKPEYLRKIDRRLYERMKALDTKTVGQAVKPFVDREELHALSARLKAIVSHYAKIADERGEETVFY